MLAEDGEEAMRNEVPLLVRMRSRKILMERGYANAKVGWRRQGVKLKRFDEEKGSKGCRSGGQWRGQ